VVAVGDDDVRVPAGLRLGPLTVLVAAPDGDVVRELGDGLHLDDLGAEPDPVA
jgi:hypothetical protein